MQERKIRVTIHKDGTYTIKALDGYEGSSCMEEAKTIEIAIGGTQIKSGKTPEYYAGDKPSVESIIH